VLGTALHSSSELSDRSLWFCYDVNTVNTPDFCYYFLLLLSVCVFLCCNKVDETLARTAETAERMEEINARMESVTRARRH